MSRNDSPNPMRVRRGKAIAKAQTLLGERGTCRMYAFGVRGPDPQRSWFWIAGGVVVACVALTLATGMIFVPGVLGIAIVRWAVNPPPGVGVADEGVLVTRESRWNARPSSIVALLPQAVLSAVTSSTRSHVCVQLGTESIWLRHREHEILLNAAQTATPTAS